MGSGIGLLRFAGTSRAPAPRFATFKINAVRPAWSAPLRVGMSARDVPGLRSQFGSAR